MEALKVKLIVRSTFGCSKCEVVLSYREIRGFSVE
jgi:hypothetical protein